MCRGKRKTHAGSFMTIEQVVECLLVELRSGRWHIVDRSQIRLRRNGDMQRQRVPPITVVAIVKGGLDVSPHLTHEVGRGLGLTEEEVGIFYTASDLPGSREPRAQELRERILSLLPSAA